MRHDHISNAKIDAESSARIFDPSNEGGTDASIFFCNGYWGNTFDFKCDEVVARFGSDNFFQHRTKLFQSIRHLPQKKIHIHRNAAVKIRECIEEQPALQNEVLRISGFLHTAQKLFLTKQLQAQLIASASLCGLVFQPCQYRGSYISH